MTCPIEMRADQQRASTRYGGDVWRVSSSDGDQWVEHDGSTWTADAMTEPNMREGAGQPIEAAPMAGQYRPTSPDDETGLFLLARYLVPGPHVITGTPPALPEPVGPDPVDRVF